MKDDHRYDALRNTTTDSRSSTEVDDLEEAGTDVRPKRWRQKTFWGKLKKWRWIIDTGLLIIIVGLLVERKWKHAKKSPSHAFDVLGDLSGFAPKFSEQIVSFTPSTKFAPEEPLDWWSNETQQAWLDIVPEGLGYVHIPAPELYNNLPTPIHDYPNLTVYTTSVTHQLHCLYTIIEAYNTLQVSYPIDPSGKPPIHMSWHINHCFEYMRQAIMCAGDVALEGAATTFPKGKNGEDLGGSDGWDAKHVCKNYGEVYKYLEERTVYHGKWIASDDVDEQ
ncbi:hypothetical protein P280DRAFT_487317 [Massarina eburnea CBS 473.64]|uniref:Uncharacterized protein n=1 Tax=Massarina eburnea CBS 473.64 TaxID=1395130 RepID=A0A6A6SAI6_9PLEO|nr:hypothetical protein P280DRAFT_487317 [Massarina eburnea CBS 473.64]